MRKLIYTTQVKLCAMERNLNKLSKSEEKMQSDPPQRVRKIAFFSFDCAQIEKTNKNVGMYARSARKAGVGLLMFMEGIHSYRSVGFINPAEFDTFRAQKAGFWPLFGPASGPKNRQIPFDCAQTKKRNKYVGMYARSARKAGVGLLMLKGIHSYVLFRLKVSNAMLWTFKKTQKSFKKSIKLMFMTTKITKNTKKTRKAGKMRDFCLFGRLKKPQKTRKNTKNGENPCFLSLWTSQKTTKIRKAGKMRDFCLFGRPKNREIPRKMGKNRQNPVKNRQF